MEPVKTLRDLNREELFDLVRLVSGNTKEHNTAAFLLALAGELRNRNCGVTEDYVLHLAAQLVT